jgi:hypothetical protein
VLEKELQKMVLDYLKKHPLVVTVWKSDTDKHTSKIHSKSSSRPPGLADIVGMLTRGRFFCIELKVDRNEPSDDQIAFLEKIKKADGFALVAYSLEEVMAFMSLIR